MRGIKVRDKVGKQTLLLPKFVQASGKNGQSDSTFIHEFNK